MRGRTLRLAFRVPLVRPQEVPAGHQAGLHQAHLNLTDRLTTPTRQPAWYGLRNLQRSC